MTNHILAERLKIIQVSRSSASTARTRRTPSLPRHVYGHDRGADFGRWEPGYPRHRLPRRRRLLLRGNDLGDFLAASMGGGMPREIIGFSTRWCARKSPSCLASMVWRSASAPPCTCIATTVCSACSQFRTPFVDLALCLRRPPPLLAPRIMGAQRAFAMLAAGELLLRRGGEGGRPCLQGRGTASGRGANA